jgi:hypothetical protein
MINFKYVKGEKAKKGVKETREIVTEVTRSISLERINSLTRTIPEHFIRESWSCIK